MKPILLALALGAVLGAWAAGPGPRLSLWTRGPAGFQAPAGAGDPAMAVGSLQKPFVVKAWAQSHPGQPAPRILCEANDRCWLASGHGELGLARALAVSCNTYFRRLAAATPLPALEASLTQAGFQAPPLTPELAIGLASPGPAVTIRPSALLAATAELITTPWTSGEPIRQELRAGLREAALTGTAAPLGLRGYWTKTGTVALAGDPLHTRGLVLAVDDSGWAILGLLEPGTGAQAARALAAPLARLRPWNQPHRPPARPQAPWRSAPVAEAEVTVRLFDLLEARHVTARNLGPAALATGTGALGPGATLDLRPGTTVGPGLLELQVQAFHFRRRFQGQVACAPGPGGTLRLTATLTPREYVAGVVAAELADGTGPLRLQLAATVLRFLAQGPRHPDAAVCDTTHCAWFVGRGPRLTWPSPQRALAAAAPAMAWGFSDPEWTEIRAAALRPGPSLWTAHCGGQPLSPQALWGFGDTQAGPCPRHTRAQARPWLREWRTADLERAFGPGLLELAATQEAGVRILRVTTRQGVRALRYDDAHRLLAAVLGWGALPSPADTVEAMPGGWRARGVGLGHRVGLCLGE